MNGLGVPILSTINRRSFLQVLGAASLAPILPALPARAAVASGGASASKALWASLYANSGSMSEFMGVARNMGLSNTAIQGVSARSIGARAVLAASKEKLTSASMKTVRPSLSPSGERLNLRNHVEQAIENCLPTEADASPSTEDQEIEILDPESRAEDGEEQIV